MLKKVHTSAIIFIENLDLSTNQSKITLILYSNSFCMPSKTPRLNATYRLSKEQLKISLSFIEFDEDNRTILYCPALDLSGYGNNEEEAKESFEVVLEEFIRYTMNKKTFFNELTKLGWKIRSKSKPITPPDMCYLLERNENFHQIFNKHSYRKYDKPVAIPVS